MKEFFFEAPYSDISFEVESQTLPAHKWLLIQRNKFFANLFSSKVASKFLLNHNQGEMSEEQTSKITITDVKAPTFRGKYFFEAQLKSHSSTGIPV